MYRLIFLTDVHAGRKPKNRAGDYHLDILEKLNRVVAFANKSSVDFLVLGGDLFDVPIVAPFIVLDFADALSRFDGKIISAIGEHDTHGHSHDQFSNTSLALLRRMLGPGSLILCDGSVSSFTVLDRISFHLIHCWDKPRTREILAAIPRNDIVVAHSLITPSELPYECTPIDTIETNASLVLSGDFHSRFLVEKNGTTFVNPGPFSRRKRTDKDPSIVYCEYSPTSCKIKMRPVTCKPLDWHTVVHQEDDHEPSVSEFAQKIQEYSRTASDIYALVEQAAESEGTDREVVELIRDLRDGSAGD